MESSRQQSFRVCYWLNVLVNEAMLSSHLGLESTTSSFQVTPLLTLKSLSLVCKEISNCVRPFIENNFWFNFTNEKGQLLRYAWYTPTRLLEYSELTTLQKITSLFFKSEPTINLNDITHLSFKKNFNQPIKSDLLPPNLTHLTLPPFFNQPLMNTLLPLTLLTNLSFGYDFDQIVDNLLPCNITHLRFSSRFNKPVDHLPPNLAHLHLGVMFDQKIDHLPLKLISLHCGALYNQSVDHLPPKLTYVWFGTNFNKCIDNLPSTITHLCFSRDFKQPISKFPPHLVYLYLNSSFDQPNISDLLPLTIEYLKIGSHYRGKIKLLNPQAKVEHWGF